MLAIPGPPPAPRSGYSKDLYGEQIAAYAAQHPGPISILEAGCGKGWKIRLPHDDVVMTGVDLNAEALRIRVEEVRDLDHAIVGDLRTVDLPAAGYDIAYCAFVLEHIEAAEAVLDRILATIKPGGLLLLSIPDRASVYSFFARPDGSQRVHRQPIRCAQVPAAWQAVARACVDS